MEIYGYTISGLYHGYIRTENQYIDIWQNRVYNIIYLYQRRSVIMLHKKIPLRGTDSNTVPYITTYILDSILDSQKKRPLVIVFPGGGYEYCSSREGEPIACEFNSAGYNAVVVEYTTNAPYPQALKDASDAIVYVREHAEEWNTDPDKIYVCGFSAGAHLAASIGIMCGKEEAIKREDKLNRPNGMILCYPVISSGEFAHRGSFDSLGAVTPDLLEKTSLELQVDKNTPPAFIWHTFTDTCVPVENSMLLASSLRKNDVPFELHIYPDGRHGLSLAKDFTSNEPVDIVPHAQGWMPLAKEWIEQL